MHPRKLGAELVTSRGEVTFGSLELTTEAGIEKRMIGYTDGGDSSLFPGQFWVRFLEQTEVAGA